MFLENPSTSKLDYYKMNVNNKKVKNLKKNNRTFTDLAFLCDILSSKVCPSRVEFYVNARYNI